MEMFGFFFGFFVSLFIIMILTNANRSRAEFYIKAGLSLASLLLTSTVGCLVAIYCTLVGDRPNINHYVGRIFAALTAPLVGVKFEIEGAEHLLISSRTPAVFISNHQSMLDLLSMARVFPKKTVVLAKKSLSYYPILGTYMVLSKNFFVHRTNTQKAIATLSDVAQYMKREGMSVYIYPEGTRSHQTTDDLLPFKKGAFHLAIQAQVPIVCLVFSTYAPDYKPLEDLPSPSETKTALGEKPIKHQRTQSSESVLKFFRQKQSEQSEVSRANVVYSSRLKRFDGGTIRVKILPPIETAGLSTDDVNSVIEKARTQMLQTLKSLSHRNSPRPSLSKTTESTKIIESSKDK